MRSYSTWCLPVCLIGLSSYASIFRYDNFEKQYDKEMKTLKKINDNYNPKDFSLQLPKSMQLVLTLDDALKLAMKNNQTIQEAIITYKQALLSYQSTLFEFKFSPGNLEYSSSYGYQDQGPELSLSNTLSKTFPNGFEYSLSNSAENNPDDNPNDMTASTSLSVSQQIIGSTYNNNMNTILTARETLAEAKLTLRDSVVSTLMDITSQFRSILFDEESLEETRKTLKGTEANIKKSELLLSMGFIAESELESIKLQEVNTKLSLQQSQFELRETMNELKVNLGLSVNDSVKLTPDLTNEKLAEKMMQEILANRPAHKNRYLYDALVMSDTLINDNISLRQNRRDLVILYQEKNISLNFSGSASYDTSSKSGSSSASLDLTLPLDNKSTNNSIQNQRLDIIGAEQQFMRDCLDTIKDEANNFQNMQHYYETTKLTNDQLKGSLAVDEASKIRFKYGSISASDVQQNHQQYLDAISSLRQAENDYVNSVDNYRQLTNRYITNMSVNLTPELDVIFQTVQLANNKRSITLPKLVFDIHKLDPDKPYEVCYALMQAPVINM